MSPPEVREVLFKENGCFLCLQQGHRVTACYSKLRCAHCNSRRHNTVLHENREMPTGATSLNATANSSNVNLPLAKSTIQGNNGKKLEINVVLDQCSNKSVKSKLNRNIHENKRAFYDFNQINVLRHVLIPSLTKIFIKIN